MTARREFTLEEARTVLLTVREHVGALQEVQSRLRATKERLNVLNRRHLNNGVVGEQESRELRQEQRQLGEDARTLVQAITGSGVELKGIDDGLLDFPTTIDGIPAYWCWKAGEDDIEWWHPRATGFAGRQRIEGLE